MLTLLPDAHDGVSVFLAGEYASAMLSAVEPLTSVDLAIGPLEGSLSFLDIVDEIGEAVGLGQSTGPRMHVRSHEDNAGALILAETVPL